MNMKRWFKISLLCTVFLMFAALPASAADVRGWMNACPSKVLFLYNKDWKGDRHFTGTGFE